MAQSNPRSSKKLKDPLAAIKERILPQDSILDVGCYHGFMYEWLGHPKDYLGIDLFQENVDTARSNFPLGEFLQGDLFNLDVKRDFVICCRVLMHVPDFEVAIKRLRACANRKLAVVIPISQEWMSVEENALGKVYFRTFAKQRVLDTGGEIIESSGYSAVFYDPLLP